ncbi:MAG: hypothetical protein AB7S56_08505 [Halothiobacillaceae bacterium]
MNNEKTKLLNQLQQVLLLKIEKTYRQYPHWLVKKGNTTLWHFERKTGLRYHYQKRPEDALAQWNEKVNAQEFWQLDTDYTIASGQLIKQQGRYGALILQTSNSLVWHWFSDWDKCKPINSTLIKLENIEVIGIKQWILPSLSQLSSFYGPEKNPVKTYGKGTKSYYATIFDECWTKSWIIIGGYVQFGYENNPHFSNTIYDGYVIAYNTLPETDPLAFWRIMRKQNVKLANFSSNTLLEIPDLDIQPNTDWKNLSFSELWARLAAEGLSLVAEDAPEVVISVDGNTHESLLNIDYTPCRLPRLEPVQLTDPNKGLWELWGEDDAALSRLELRARDPSKDVRHEWVAIDFGTSSTVVAVATPEGGKKLLRVGVSDYGAPPQARQFENPTVLEFLDFDALMNIWQAQVYRPQLDWAWVRAANEALLDYRRDANLPQTVNSVMLYLKRWARECDQVVARIVDQFHGKEHVLAPLTERNPVRGQPMLADADAPFDPIELYAWYLGMVINWRNHGLYLKYALTFPVKYENAVRQKILASFRRGLQRSFPASLVDNSELFNQFEVRDIGTEPMAYAAAMLPELGLAPSLEGLSYAVFDFGGGTTDFDFGRWRLPLPDEADEGIESVLERLGAGGDPTLGGENLLALMAYQVFQDNLQAVQAAKLVFTRPASEPAFVGGEALIDQSSLAQANTAVLMQRLRPLLESPENFDVEQVNLDMRDRGGAEVSVLLQLHVEEIEALLRQRVARGVQSFLSEMQAAFSEEMPAELHILLAGNASLSARVREAFDASAPQWQEWVASYFGVYAPRFEVHFAQAADEKQFYKPSCKTAVALGALDLVPGSPLVWRDLLHSRSASNAPFNFFAGGLVQQVLQPVLTPGCAYGEWREMGIVREGVFTLAWSLSPRARGGMRRGDPEIVLRDLRFPDAGKGFRCFARVVAPAVIELTAAASRDALEHAEYGSVQTVSLSAAR